MIQEHVREMTADEREDMRRALQPVPLRPLPSTQGSKAGLVVAAVLTAGALVWTRGAVDGALAAALVAGWGVILYHYLSSVAEEKKRRTRHERFSGQAAQALARILQDGRVTVKRVRAVAVVEIESIEDEGNGYVYDLGDGRVLFLKGQDYFASDEDTPWPNTEFEIIRTVAEGRMYDLRCLGSALAPLRVVPGDDVDPQKGWEDREEVLEMSVDDAVRRILRTR